MKKEDWTVGEEGIRPSTPNGCFYCDEPVGSQHKPECVIRERTVVVRMTVDIVMTQPESWDDNMIEFHKNEGSWCSDNIIDHLEWLSNKHGCICPFTEFKYLREATKEDEEFYGVFIEQHRS